MHLESSTWEELKVRSSTVYIVPMYKVSKFTYKLKIAYDAQLLHKRIPKRKVCQEIS